MADDKDTSGNHDDKKYDFDPITSEDIIVSIALGGKPVEALMIGEATMFLDSVGFIPDYRKHIPEIKKMTIDRDDVIICAFARSGTHWTWEITEMLFSGNAEYHKKSKVTAMLEFIPAEQLRVIPKPRIYNTHFTPSSLPNEVMENKCKIIFVHRNPKDVLVSLLPFMKGIKHIEEDVTWEKFINSYMKLDVESSLFNWFYYTRSCHQVLKTNPDNIHTICYEDLKEDPIKEITKLARFLKVKENITLIEDIADKCSFNNLKTAAKTKINHENEKKRDLQFFYRKGEVGDWTNHFTVDQSERFDAVLADSMQGIDIKYRYTL